VTERLDNYPGFPDGVAGHELADRMRRQAERYGVEILQAVAVQDVVSVDDDWVEVTTAADDTYRARAVLTSSARAYISAPRVTDPSIAERKKYSSSGEETVAWKKDCF
jgi:thioredoxin reductase (NADPH)